MMGDKRQATNDTTTVAVRGLTCPDANQLRFAWYAACNAVAAATSDRDREIKQIDRDQAKESLIQHLIDCERCNQ